MTKNQKQHKPPIFIRKTKAKPAPNISPSNPVAPTTFLRAFGIVEKKNLSLNLSAQVLEALGQIGKALQVLAGASTGPGNFHVHPPAALYGSPPPPDDSLTVAALVNEFLRAKHRAGRSDRYLRALRNSLVKFSAGRAGHPVASVTVGEVEKWIHGQNWAIRTKKGYLGDVSTLFNYAVKRGYLVRNPAAPVELAAIVQAPPGIHSPADMRAVLAFALAYQPSICRALAVRYFAGLRSAEVERLAESSISAKYIEVTAQNAKTRRRRLVAIQPVLAHWLAVTSQAGGALPVTGSQSNVWRDFNAALLRSPAAVPWSHNVTRHSFVSYHLGQWGNTGKTALEAGTSESMIFAHYRELVTGEAAADYWALPGKLAIQAENSAGPIK